MNVTDWKRRIRKVLDVMLKKNPSITRADKDFALVDDLDWEMNFGACKMTAAQKERFFQIEKEIQ